MHSLNRLALSLLLVFGLCGQADSASMTLMGVGGPPAATGFVGPGDVISGAIWWYGLRAYSAAKRGTKAINLCDNAGANCADISTNAVTGNLNSPGTLGANNCTTSGTCQINILYDQSGANTCGGGTVPCDLNNTTGAQRPTLLWNCIGTLPCMVASGTQSLTTTSISNPTVTQPFTSSYVAKRTTTAAESGIFGANGVTWRFRATNTASEFASAFLEVATATENTWNAIQGVINNASSDINVNGTAHTGTAGATNITGTATVGLVVFEDTFGTFLTGQITEVGTWNVAFSSGNSTSMCHNQFTYWGTSTSC